MSALPESGTLNVSRSYSVLPGICADRPTKTRSARIVVLDSTTLAELATAWSAVERLMVSCGPDVEQHRAGYMSVPTRAHRTRRADQHAADIVGKLLSDGHGDRSG